LPFHVPKYHWFRTVFLLIPAIAVYTGFFGTLSIASSFFDKTGYFAHWCARTWSRWILRTTGVHVEISGLEQLDPKGTYVFVANHQSIYDIPILFWSLPHQLRIIAKESLGRFPVIGWHLRRTGHMLVDRSRPDRSKIFGWASRLTSHGLSLIVFPEGTRSRDGYVAKFKGGSFYLTGEYMVLEPYSRIVHVERMHLPDPTPDNHVETRFDPDGSGTLLTMRMTLPDAETRTRMLASGMEHGMEASYERLERMI